MTTLRQGELIKLLEERVSRSPKLIFQI